MGSRDYSWFIKADMRKYKGKYVIVRRRRVVLSGHDLKELLSRFRRRYPKEMPIITKIPKDELLVLVITWHCSERPVHAWQGARRMRNTARMFRAATYSGYAGRADRFGRRM